MHQPIKYACISRLQVARIDNFSFPRFRPGNFKFDFALNLDFDFVPRPAAPASTSIAALSILHFVYQTTLGCVKARLFEFYTYSQDSPLSSLPPSHSCSSSLPLLS